MNFSQLHERLRAEIARRIHRGILTGTLLASQAGLKPSHISNFLRRKRKLSLEALDRVLTAQALTIEDLLPESLAMRSRGSTLENAAGDHVPLVSHSAASDSPAISQSVTLGVIRIPPGILDQLRPRRTIARRDWQRFVAVRLTASQALPMYPRFHPQSIVVLDRHYNSLVPYRPPQPDVYGVNANSSLVFRYVSLDSRRVILRPHALDHPVELLELDDDASPSDLIVGRVCYSLSPH